MSDPAASPLRVAFSVGRSVGSATRRNRLRRRLRSIVPTAASSAGIGSGWLLIGTKPTARELAFDTLRSEVEQLCRQITSGPGAGS